MSVSRYSCFVESGIWYFYRDSTWLGWSDFDNWIYLLATTSCDSPVVQISASLQVVGGSYPRNILLTWSIIDVDCTGPGGPRTKITTLQLCILVVITWGLSYNVIIPIDLLWHISMRINFTSITWPPRRQL